MRPEELGYQLWLFANAKLMYKYMYNTVLSLREYFILGVFILIVAERSLGYAGQADLFEANCFDETLLFGFGCSILHFTISIWHFPIGR